MYEDLIIVKKNFLLDIPVYQDCEDIKHARGSIYFIQFQNYIKIGRSDNLSQRRTTIELYLPEDIKLLGRIFTWFSVEWEMKLHNHFRKYRSKNDWFKLDFNTIDQYLIKDIQVKND